MKLMGKSVKVPPNLVVKMGTKAVVKGIKRTIDKGIGIEIGM